PGFRPGVPRVDVEGVAAARPLPVAARLYRSLSPEYLAGGGVAEIRTGVVETLLDVEDLQPRAGRGEVAEAQRAAMAQTASSAAAPYTISSRPAQRTVSKRGRSGRRGAGGQP